MARVSTKQAEPEVKMNRGQLIEQLMATGATNEAVFAFMSAKFPAIIDKDDERRRYTNGKYLAPNKKLAEEIRNQIRVTRTQYDKLRAEITTQNEQFGRGKVVKLSEVVPEDIFRVTTGNPNLDKLWGCHEETRGGKKILIWGPPRSKITLLGGQRGVGKSRWIIMVAVGMADKTKAKILIIQNEVTAAEYSGWVKKYIKESGLSMSLMDYIHVSDQANLNDQLVTIEELVPDLVVVDSINFIRESKTARGQYDICMHYHTRCHKLKNHGPHIIFIAHMNKQGEIKGSTDIQHYVDIVMYARKRFPQGNFIVECPDKNRYGETGKHKKFRHKGACVVMVKDDGSEPEPYLQIVETAAH